MSSQTPLHASLTSPLLTHSHLLAHSHHRPPLVFATQLNLKYFDTVPVSVGLNLLKNGMLFVPAEFGNHALYQVQQLGDNEDEPTFSSHSPASQAFEFAPRPLRNLMLYEEAESLAPVLACHIADLAGEDAPQLYVDPPTFCLQRPWLVVNKHVPDHVSNHVPNSVDPSLVVNNSVGFFLSKLLFVLRTPLALVLM
jgi:hypothetical protein